MAQDDLISLRFGLREDTSADLEVIASATLQWINVVQAAARSLDPDAHVRILIIDADKTSLRLNAVFEWVEKQLERIDTGSSQYPRLRKVAIALAVFLAIDAGPTVDHYIGDTSTINLNDEDRQRIDKLLEQIKSNPEVSRPRQHFFRELERDPAISSVEISEGPSAEPLASVPSTEFAERSGLWRIEEEEGERTTYHVMDVILIRPVLLNASRSWRFKPEGLPEFDAVMRDRAFLSALEHEYIQERLRTGINMKIRLEVKEHFRNNTWKVRRGGRSITQVISPRIV